jgi:hypothetical protein
MTETRIPALVAVAVSAALAACHPDVPSGKFLCGSSSDCPDGFSCELSRLVCVSGKSSAQSGVPMSPGKDSGGAVDAAANGGETGQGSAGMAALDPAGRIGTDAGSGPTAGRAGPMPHPIAGASGAGTQAGAPQGGAGSGAANGGAGARATSVGGAPGPCAMTSCGSECADLDSDPAHCGACDHSCGRGACSAGRCQPVHLSGAGVLAEDLHVGDDAVYWTERDPGRLKKVGLDGGVVTTLASDVFMYELALDAQSVYAASASVLWKVPRAGGSGVTLLSDARAYSVGTDGSFVYFSGSDVSLQRVPVEGGTPSVLAMNASGSALTVRDGFVYWSNYQTGTINRSSVTGGTPVVLASGLSYPVAIAVDGQYVYWADETDLNLMQQDLGGGTPSVVASNVTCTDIATDGVNVYWVDYLAQGSIQMRAAAGGATRKLAEAQAAPISLDVDAAFVYWVNRGVDEQLGEVLKVAK